MKKEEEKSEYQKFIEEAGRKVSEKQDVLRPGCILPIHLNKLIGETLQVQWGNIQSKSHTHPKSDITGLPWLWPEVSKLGSILDDLGDVNVPSPSNQQVLAWDTALSKWIAIDSPGGAGHFIDLLDVPSSYVGYGEYFVKVNVAESGLEFVASSVLAHNILSASHGDTVVGSVVLGDLIFGNSTPKWARLAGNSEAIKKFLTQKGAGGAVSAGPSWNFIEEGDFDFYDDFNDSSIHWAWKTHNTSAQKTITEASGVLTISVNEGTQAIWSTTVNSAPKVYMGAPGQIYEILCKLSAVTINVNTAVCLQVSDRSESYASPCFFACQRVSGGIIARYQGVGTSDLVVELTLPIYFKIRFTGSDVVNRLQAYYSTDGINWISFKVGANDYIVNNYSGASRGFAVGLYVENWSDGGAYHAVSGSYDWLKVTRPLGPR